MLLLGWQTHCPRRRTSADINIVNVVRTHLATTAENRTNRIVYGFFSGLSCVERSNQTANFLLNKIDLNALNEQNNKLYRFDTIDPIRIWIWTSLVRSCGWCRREDSIYSLFWLMLTWLFSSQWQTWMTLCRSCCRSWWSVALLCANLIILGSRGPLSQVSIAWLVTSCISSVFVFCVDNLILCFFVFSLLFGVNSRTVLCSANAVINYVLLYAYRQLSERLNCATITVNIVHTSYSDTL